MNKLKYLRKEKGLTQSQFAQEMGVTQAAISRWENDVTSIDPANFDKLCAYFGISEEDLNVSLYTEESLFQFIEANAEDDRDKTMVIGRELVKGLIALDLPQNYCKAVVAYHLDDVLKFLVDIWPSMSERQQIELFGYCKGMLGNARFEERGNEA